MTAGLPTGSWYDDLCSCLQVDLAAVLRWHGWDPLHALGAQWRFAFTPGTCEPVEFYHPSTAELLPPSVEVAWHHPTSADDSDLREAVASGRPPIVAVDNFHLPFRPAYQDVHAAHLLVVTGFQGDTATVLDPMPPAYSGPLPLDVLDAARSSVTVTDPTDPFFAGSALGRRWLSVCPVGPQPALTWGWLVEVVSSNLAGFAGPGVDSSGRLSGLSGFGAYVSGLPARDMAAVRQELYVLGWWMQAMTALHGMFLARAGRALGRPELVEAGRWVDLVAHEWTGLRMTAVHGPADNLLASRIVARGRRVLRAWEKAVDGLELVLEVAA
ncbi:hypothetical protein GCM10029964_049810 [Kibdelosporangium lantanae]